jgi:hypothetical protein
MTTRNSRAPRRASGRGPLPRRGANGPATSHLESFARGEKPQAGASFLGVSYAYEPPPSPDTLADLPDAPPAEAWRWQPPEQADEPTPITRATLRPTREQLSLIAGAALMGLILVLGLPALLSSTEPAPAAPTAAIAEATAQSAPAAPAFPTPGPLTGWWSPDGEPVEVPQPLSAEFYARCSARTDIVQMKLDSGALVWFRAEDVAVDAATVAGLAIDVCGGQ